MGIVYPTNIIKNRNGPSLDRTRSELFANPMADEQAWLEQVTWNPKTIPQTETCIKKDKATKPILGTLKPEIQKMENPPAIGTNWVLSGLLLCGRSPDEMTDGQLSAVVEAGVDTFVCLQESYTEYGCRDYRVALQALARDAVKTK